MTKGGKYVELSGGAELYVRDIGQGEPLVFIPGWTFTLEVFEKQIGHFAKTHRVIAIDPRSHGQSTVTAGGNEYITHAKDLQTVLQALEVHEPTLIGWSFGCLTIWEYVRQFGADSIKSCILVDMSPKALSVNEGDWTEGSLNDIAAAYTNYLCNSKGQRAFVENYARNVMVQRDLNEKELQWLIEQSLNTPYYIAANLFAAGMFSDYRKEARQVSEAVPTLAIVAEHWQDAAKGTLAHISPAMKVEVLGGHLMFWEYDKAFNAIIEEFLKG